MYQTYQALEQQKRRSMQMSITEKKRISLEREKLEKAHQYVPGNETQSTQGSPACVLRQGPVLQN